MNCRFFLADQDWGMNVHFSFILFFPNRRNLFVDWRLMGTLLITCPKSFSSKILLQTHLLLKSVGGLARLLLLLPAEADKVLLLLLTRSPLLLTLEQLCFS
jgi:hypothetical protein